MKEDLRVLVLIPAEGEHRRMLEQAAPGAEFVYRSVKEDLTGELKKADVVIGNPPLKGLSGLERLQWIQLNSAGANQYTPAGVLREGTMLTNATGAYGLAISEYMIGGVLEVFKNLHLYRDQQNRSLWKYAGRVKSIYGAKVLILGLGDIGGEFARRVKALGGYTVGIKRRLGDKPEFVDELYSMEELERLLPEADVVAISLPETPQTYHLMDERRLGLMKADSVLVNVGRGNIVDTDALCHVLEKGSIRGALLDVTDPEPLPEEHPIWKLPNAVITPHVSGGFSLPETFHRIVKISADNLRRFVAGEELENQVDFTTGYKK